jgi:hypothetical protein
VWENLINSRVFRILRNGTGEGGILLQAIARFFLPQRERNFPFRRAIC